MGRVSNFLKFVTQFHVHGLLKSGGRLVLDVQSVFHQSLASCWVVPIRSEFALPKPAPSNRIYVPIRLNGRLYYADFAGLTAVRRVLLGVSLMDASGDRDAFVRAIDVMIGGF